MARVRYEAVAQSHGAMVAVLHLAPHLTPHLISQSFWCESSLTVAHCDIMGEYALEEGRVPHFCSSFATARRRLEFNYRMMRKLPLPVVRRGGDDI